METLGDYLLDESMNPDVQSALRTQPRAHTGTLPAVSLAHVKLEFTEFLISASSDTQKRFQVTLKYNTEQSSFT